MGRWVDEQRNAGLRHTEWILVAVILFRYDDGGNGVMRRSGLVC